MTSVAVLIPAFVRDDEWRQKALARVLLHYTQNHGAWKISVADHGGGPWRKGAAVIEALHSIRASVLVVADADVMADPEALQEAVDAVTPVGSQGIRGPAWATPHGPIRRLDRESTVQLYDYGEIPERPVLTRPTYRNRGQEGGGITVVPRQIYVRCPIDPRFEGWGSEDVCWGLALRCLYGPPWSGDGTLWHLYHDHPAPGQSKSQNVQGRELHRRYYKHAHDPEGMRALLAEIA